MTSAISIALSFDEAYAEHATVMLYSLLHNNAKHHFDIWVFYNDLKPETQNRIQKDLKLFQHCDLHWCVIDKKLISSFKRREGHVNDYCYTRIYLGDFLPQLERVLYLDCDTLVLEDIDALWNIDLKDKCLGAVLDPSLRFHDIGLPKEASYFNSGLLLIDLKKWRAEQYTRKVIDKLYELGERAWERDQDGLNAVLFNDCLLLNDKWNVQSHTIAEALEHNRNNLKGTLSPVIVHFTGNLKPWNYKSSNPYKREYYDYLSKTSFAKSHKPENKTPINVARRMVRNILVTTGVLKY